MHRPGLWRALHTTWPGLRGGCCALPASPEATACTPRDGCSNGSVSVSENCTTEDSTEHLTYQLTPDMQLAAARTRGGVRSSQRNIRRYEYRRVPASSGPATKYALHVLLHGPATSLHPSVMTKVRVSALRFRTTPHKCHPPAIACRLCTSVRAPMRPYCVPSPGDELHGRVDGPHSIKVAPLKFAISNNVLKMIFLKSRTGSG